MAAALPAGSCSASIPPLNCSKMMHSGKIGGCDFPTVPGRSWRCTLRQGKGFFEWIQTRINAVPGIGHAPGIGWKMQCPRSLRHRPPHHPPWHAFPNSLCLTHMGVVVQEAEKIGKAPDFLYCKELLENTGIVTVPGSGFRQVALCTSPPIQAKPATLLSCKHSYCTHLQYAKSTSQTIQL